MLLTAARAPVLIPKDLGFSSSENTVVKETQTPTAREMEILKVLWEHGSSSVKFVHLCLVRADELEFVRASA